MLNVGPQELMVVLIIALLVVGPKRLPELARQLGKGMREFRKIQDDVKGMVNLDDIKDMVRFDTDVTPDPTPVAAPSNVSTPATSQAALPATATPLVHRAARPAPVEPSPASTDDPAGAD